MNLAFHDKIQCWRSGVWILRNHQDVMCMYLIWYQQNLFWNEFRCSYFYQMRLSFFVKLFLLSVFDEHQTYFVVVVASDNHIYYLLFPNNIECKDKFRTFDQKFAQHEKEKNSFFLFLVFFFFARRPHLLLKFRLLANICESQGR